MDLARKLDMVEKIKKAKACYSLFVDAKQWQALRALFTPDARFHGEEAGMGKIEGIEGIEGIDGFLDGCLAGLTKCVNVHHSRCPEIEPTSEITATGIRAIEDMLQWSESSGSPLHGMGRYFEYYAKLGGASKIASWKLIRLRAETAPA